MTAEQMITILISLFVGWLGVPLTNYLKDKLGWEDKSATMLAAGVALVMAFLALFLSGQISADMFEISNIPTTFGLVFSFSTLFYKLLNKKPELA